MKTKLYLKMIVTEFSRAKHTHVDMYTQRTLRLLAVSGHATQWCGGARSLLSRSLPLTNSSCCTTVNAAAVVVCRMFSIRTHACNVERTYAQPQFSLVGVFVSARQHTQHSVCANR